MKKVELTKNVFNHKNGIIFGLKPLQLVFVGIALIVGVLTVLWLRQYELSLDLIGWIVFLELVLIIGLGVVRPGGRNLFSYLISMLNPDTRYYCTMEDEMDEEE